MPNRDGEGVVLQTLLYMPSLLARNDGRCILTVSGGSHLSQHGHVSRRILKVALLALLS